MTKIGITGNIGSGKSAVEEILIKKGFKTICADRISHNLFNDNERVREKIYNIFKTNDRFEIGKIVFQDKVKRQELENILHPEIKKEIEEKLKEDKGLTFAFVPLLFEANLENLFDKIILISASEEIRLNRIIKRNNYDIKHAQDRINSQVKEEEKIKKCDFILKNEGDFKDLEKNLDEILEKLSKI